MGFEFHLCFRFNNNTIRLAVGKKLSGLTLELEKGFN